MDFPNTLTAYRNPNYYTPEHEQFRETVRAFVAREMAPYANEWDEAETFPRELYRKAAQAGLLGLGYPEEYGGTPCDIFYKLILAEEMARSGAGGVNASLKSHTIGSPPILAAGSTEMKKRVLPAVLAGEKISALAITEPSGGSDVASLKTTAIRDGDHYVVNGSKIFITSGMRADYFTVAVRTNPEDRGAGGVSLLLIERDTPGFTRTPLKKMGWWASDTATAALRQLPRAGVEPDRRGEQGLSHRHAQLQLRAHRHGGRRLRLRAGVPRGRAGLGARAQDLRACRCPSAR
jgi:acyl-CoA dehydrogenase